MFVAKGPGAGKGILAESLDMMEGMSACTKDLLLVGVVGPSAEGPGKGRDAEATGERAQAVPGAAYRVTW